MRRWLVGPVSGLRRKRFCAGVLEDAYSGENTAQYVFRRFTRGGRQAELLSLPEAFNAQLHSWLLRQVLAYPAQHSQP